MDYKKANFDYWQSGYETQYPDTNLVKLFHHILKHEMPVKPGMRALDYGCSNGTHVRFLDSIGFDAHGVDVNKVAIEKANAPHAVSSRPLKFMAIPFEIFLDDNFFGGNFDLILSWHALYYLSNRDFYNRLITLSHMLKPGGLFVATMVSEKSSGYDNSQPAQDGLRKLPIIERLRALHGKEHFVNFVEDEYDMAKRFDMFRSLHVGYIHECQSMSIGENLFHYIFVGKKI